MIQVHHSGLFPVNKSRSLKSRVTNYKGKVSVRNFLQLTFLASSTRTSYKREDNEKNLLLTDLSGQLGRPVVLVQENSLSRKHRESIFVRGQNFRGHFFVFEWGRGTGEEPVRHEDWDLKKMDKSPDFCCLWKWKLSYLCWFVSRGKSVLILVVSGEFVQALAV